MNNFFSTQLLLKTNQNQNLANKQKRNFINTLFCVYFVILSESNFGSQTERYFGSQMKNILLIDYLPDILLCIKRFLNSTKNLIGHRNKKHLVMINRKTNRKKFTAVFKYFSNF